MKALFLLLCLMPAALFAAGQEQRLPRLIGIVALPGTKLALLETTTNRRESFMFAENQSDSGITVLRIDPETETIQLRLGFERNTQSRLWDTNSGQPADKALAAAKAEPGVAAAEFSEDGKQIIVVITNAPGTIGFDPQNKTVEPANPGLVFEKVGLGELLRVYEELAGRTLLRDPVLPAAKFTLRVRANTPAEAAAALEAALAEQQISCVPDGEKFMMVVPKARAGKVRPRSSELKAGGKAAEEIFPAGVINFQAVPIFQVAQIYAEIMGRELDRSDTSQAYPHITLRTRNPLTKTEIIYALQTVFEWSGCQLLETEGKRVKLVPF